MSDKLEQIVSLVFTMRQISNSNFSNEKCKEFSVLHYIALRYIQEKKPLMKELAEFLAITPPSATSLINTLSGAGLAKRVEEKNDRRIVRLFITKKGEENLKKKQEIIAHNMRKRLECLNKKEREDLIKILTKLSKNSIN